MLCTVLVGLLFLSGETAFAQVISTSGTVSINNTSGTVIVTNSLENNTGSTLDNDGTISTSDLTNGGTLQGNGTYGIAGAFTNSGTFTIGTSTVDFNGTGAQSIPAYSFYHLTTSSTGARTLPNGGTVSIAGTFTPGGSNTFTVTGSTIDFNGSGAQTIPAFNFNNLTSSSTGARTLVNGGTIGVAGTFTKGTNSYTVTGNTFNYNSTGSQNVTGFTYHHLTVSGSGTATLAATVVVNGDLSLSGGTFDLGAFTADRASSGGIFTIAALCTLRIGGTGTTLPANYSTKTFDPTSRIEYYGTGQSLPSGTYDNLNVSGSGTTITLSSNIDIAGDLIVSDGTLDLSTFTANRLTSGGTLTVGAGGTLRIGGTNTIPSNYTTYSFDPTGTVEFYGTSHSITALNYGNLTVTSSGAITLPASTVGVSGTFTPGSGTYTTTGNTIEYNSTGAQSVAAFDYNNLTLSTGGTKTLAVGTTKIAGTLTLSGASADATTNSSTVEFNGTGAQTVNALTYYNLTFTAGGTKTIFGTVTVNNNVVTNAGSVVVIDASGTMIIHGDLDNSGSFTNHGIFNMVP